MFILKVNAEKEPDGIDQRIQNYHNMLAEMGYGPGHDDDDTKEGLTIQYSAHAKIVTTEMNTNAAAFKPSGRRDDCVDDEEDAEEKVTTLAAQYDDRVINFIADSVSGPQSHNLQDIKAFGLERSETSTAGYIASSPTGASGLPRAIIDGGGKQYTAGHAGPFKAATEDGQSIVIQNMANAQGFENNILSVSLPNGRGISVKLGVNPCLRKGGTTIAVHGRYGLYYADRIRPEASTIATTHTNTHDDQGTSRSCDIEELDIQHIAANTICTYMLEYMAKIAVHRAHIPHLQVAGRLATGELGSTALIGALRTSRGRDSRGCEQARRLSGNHFCNSYDKIGYDDWPDQGTRPPPRVSGRELEWCDDHGRWGGYPTNHCRGVGWTRNGVGLLAHIAVIYTTPAPPPLLTADNETP